MNALSKKRITAGLVILLVAANLAMLGSFLWNKMHKGGFLKTAEPKAFVFLVKALNMTKDQENAYRLLKTEHHQKVEEQRKIIQQERDSLFDLIKLPATPDSVTQLLANNIGRHEAMVNIITLEHFKKVRVLCTPAQQQQFDKVIKDMLQQIAPSQNAGNNNQPPPQGPPPTDGNRPPPPPDGQGSNGMPPPPPPGNPPQ